MAVTSQPESREWEDGFLTVTLTASHVSLL